MLAKKRFINDMKPEVETYLYNVASKVSGGSAVYADNVIDLYPDAAEAAVKEMTLIACKKFPEAFCQFVLTRACETFLLDSKNDGILFSNNNFTKDGQTILDIYEACLNSIASDPTKPAGQHNINRLEFVKNQLHNRVK